MNFLSPEVIMLCGVNYRPQRQGNIFTGVCQSFCLQGVSARHPQADTPLGRHPLGRHPMGRHPMGRHPMGRHPPGRHPQAGTPPQADTPWQHSLPQWPLQLIVRILLECFLLIWAVFSRKWSNMIPRGVLITLCTMFISFNTLCITPIFTECSLRDLIFNFF